MNNIIILLLASIMLGAVKPPSHSYYIPFVGSKDILEDRLTERLGVAAGWRFEEKEAELLNVSLYHNWSLEAKLYWANDLGYLNTFWSSCYPSDSQCDTSYMNEIYAMCSSDPNLHPINSMKWDDKVIIAFLNEPENTDQANDQIDYAAYYFKYIKDVCGNKVAMTSPMLTFPKCWFPASSHPHLQYLTAKYGEDQPYCWLKEFIQVYQQTYGELPEIELFAVHAHHSLGWVSKDWYKPSIASIYSDLYSVYSEFYGTSNRPPLLITEYSSCDPAYIREFLQEAKLNTDIIGIFGWIPNLPDDHVSGLCTRYFAPYGSMQLTPVGCAFARREDC